MRDVEQDYQDQERVERFDINVTMAANGILAGDNRMVEQPEIVAKQAFAIADAIEAERAARRKAKKAR